MREKSLTEKTQESVARIREADRREVKIALILGSGLGPLAESLTDSTLLPFTDIPHFQASTAPGHAGRIVVGKLAGKTVLCLQGRLHFYEGYTMSEVVYPIRVLAALGIETVILTNACGGLDPAMTPGELLLITDHINYMGTNPLIGPNEDDFGTRFPDMTHVYARALQEKARQAAASLQIPLREGVYVSYMGPSFETPAEIRMMQGFGGSVVGMSTVPEAIVARHSGLSVLGLSCITNLAAGILDVPLSGEEVNEAAGRAARSFTALLTAIVESLD